MASEDDEVFINTQAEWETEPEEEFLNRILGIIDDGTIRSSMQTTLIRLFILDRLDPEFAKSERAGLIGPPPWAKEQLTGDTDE